MSFHRENVIWQSPDGTWNLAFYRAHECWSSDEDYDPEWDVEYDYSSFSWLSRGHVSMDAARQSWNGANPGCSTEAREASRVKELESIADAYTQARHARA